MMPIHMLFDLLAWSGGGLLGLFVRRRWLADAPTPGLLARPWWYACAMIGAIGGALMLGSLNVRLAGRRDVGRRLRRKNTGGKQDRRNA